jgi:cyanophycinase
LKSVFLYGDIGENFDSTSIPFIQSAGGSNARIAVLGMGGPTWESYFNRVFRDRWLRFGVQEVISITPNDNMALNEEVASQLQKYSGLLICGGDTRIYHTVYSNNPTIKDAILSLYQKGIPVAGVSAGALISTSHCTIWRNKVTNGRNEFIIRSKYDATLKDQELITGHGLGLIQNCIIEPHFIEYGGFPRLIAAMQRTSAHIGLGIDEPVCLEIKDEVYGRVHGKGRAYYIKKKEDDFNVQILEPGQDFLLTKILKGKVVSGLGNFSFWIEKLHGYYKSKTGMDFFPGTLNIQLSEPYDVP